MRLGKEITDESLCTERWRRSYFFANQRVFETTDSFELPIPIVTSEVKTSRILSQHEKFRKAKLIASQLASLASEASGALFLQRMELLAKISGKWQQNLEVWIDDHDDEIDSQHQILTSPDQEIPTSPVVSSHEELLSTLGLPIADGTMMTLDLPVIDISKPGSSYEGIPLQFVPSTGNISGSNGAADENLDIDINDSRLEDRYQHLKAIQVPPALKQRGRPKGAEKTVIGFKKKENRFRKPNYAFLQAP